MITVNSLQINDVATNIQVDVSTEAGQVFTEVLIWPYTSSESEAIDISDLIAGVSENEVFAVSNDLLGVDHITGMYLLKFTTDETYVPGDYTTSNTFTTYVANTLPYNLCVLNRVMGLEVDECGKVEAPNNCEECKSELMNIHIYLETLDFTLRYGYVNESIKIFNALDQMCEVCNTCPTYTDELLINGTGYGVENNVIILT